MWQWREAKKFSCSTLMENSVKKNPNINEDIKFLILVSKFLNSDKQIFIEFIWGTHNIQIKMTLKQEILNLSPSDFIYG